MVHGRFSPTLIVFVRTVRDALHPETKVAKPPADVDVVPSGGICRSWTVKDGCAKRNTARPKHWLAV
jgi:hypothetical protein